MIKKIKPNPELKNTLIIVWGISAIVSAVIITSIIFINEGFLLSKIPTCPSKLQNQECILCGSSRAFFEIKKFNFAHAYQLNKLSIFIFSGMLINTSIFLFYIYQKIKKINIL